MSVHLLKPKLKRVAQYAVLYRVIYAFREYRKGELLPCGKEIAPLGHPVSLYAESKRSFGRKRLVRNRRERIIPPLLLYAF